MNRSKTELRRDLKRIRASLSAEERATASRAIQQRLHKCPRLAAAQHWFVYVSFRDEVETRDLINQLLVGGKQVYVPRTDGGAQMQALAFSGWDAMEVEKFGFLAPPPDAPVATELDVCVCPGLAFTREGDRLGYGAGHYDRFLAAWPDLTTVGLGFARQIVETLPRETTDRLMERIVTEQESSNCGSEPGEIR